MIEYLGTLTQPLTAKQIPSSAFAFSFVHIRDYDQHQQETLHAVFDPDTLKIIITALPTLTTQLAQINLSDLSEPVIKLGAPLPLGTRAIAKPWGEEIWFTGIETRGVCDIHGVPLPHLLQAMYLLGITDNHPPILLKILAPFPDEGLGDLYFELHEKKQEVYVVTDIHSEAWGAGPGKLKYGFNNQLVEQHKNADEFKSAFLAAVKQYENIRRKIDQWLDQAKNKEGLVDPISPESNKRLLALLDPTWQQAETTARAHMESFTQLVDVNVGDVLKVEKNVPHSLQHGVRVVEFQTPHYERFILSFAQKVVTQNHWDTEQAMARVEMSPAPVVQPQDLETIVEFDEFTVDRITLAPGESRALRPATYCLLMGITGTVVCKDCVITAEQGFYLSSVAGDVLIANECEEIAIVLQATPSKNLPH